jgi:GNAT superfamily N-acetyltransferase
MDDRQKADPGADRTRADYRVAIVPEPGPEIYQTILEGVRSFNRETLFPTAPPSQDLAIAITGAQGRVLGGLWARTGGGWLAIDLLFVPENLRGQGLASRLLAMAEAEARSRGCHAAWLDTLNPDALTLYRKLGYEIFGELKDYPPGFSRHFLQKRLDAQP